MSEKMKCTNDTIIDNNYKECWECRKLFISAGNIYLSFTHFNFSGIAQLFE